MSVIRLWWNFVRVGVMGEMQYRVNFLVQLLQSAIALATGLIVLALIFSYTQTLGGWTGPELLALMGVHTLVGGLIHMTIQPNMERLMQDVQQGTLDYALIKPADSQALVSVREFRLWQGVDVIIGALVIGYAVYQLREVFGWEQALSFGLALLCGAAMIYAFWLILTTGAFWFVRMENLLELWQGLYSAGRAPVGIYPDWLRYGLTFLVPVAFAVTVPAEAVTGRLTLTTLAGAAALAAALLLGARWFWFFGLKNYSGASA